MYFFAAPPADGCAALPVDADGCAALPDDADGCAALPDDADGCAALPDDALRRLAFSAGVRKYWILILPTSSVGRCMEVRLVRCALAHMPMMSANDGRLCALLGEEVEKPSVELLNSIDFKHTAANTLHCSSCSIIPSDVDTYHLNVKGMHEHDLAIA